MLKKSALTLFIYFFVHSSCTPSDFGQYNQYSFPTQINTLTTLSPRININTLSYQFGLKPDTGEIDWQSYLENEKLSEYPALCKMFTPQLKRLFLNDPALKPVFLSIVPDKYKGPIEALNPASAEEFGGVQTLKNILERYSGFQVKDPTLINALAEKGEIVIGCTDRYSLDTMQYAVANNRQVYFPLPDGTFIGVKGSGQNSGGLQFGVNHKDVLLPFYQNKRRRRGQLEGVLELSEIYFALKASDLLPHGLNSSFIQFLGYQKLYALPDSKGAWGAVEISEPGLVFYRVLTPHRLTKLPQLLKTDPGLTRLRRNVSIVMDKFRFTPSDIPKGAIISAEQLMLLIARNMGAGEAYKQKNLLFKMILHNQDINWAGQECDLEEMCIDEIYEKNLQADHDLGIALYSRTKLGARDIREKIKILLQLMEYSGDHRDELFPHPQRAIETFFEAYFSGLDESYLTLFAGQDQANKAYAPVEVIFNPLEGNTAFSYLGGMQRVKTLVIKMAREKMEKINSARKKLDGSVPLPRNINNHTITIQQSI